MMDKHISGRPKEVCVCVLAHNEQTHIQATIEAIVFGNQGVDFDLIVYANGCTDNTAKIVKELQKTIPNLYLRELEQASKVSAWNAAFQENNSRFLIFSDGDVLPEHDSVMELLDALKQKDKALSYCQYWPVAGASLGWQQKIAGFLQIPFLQDFLTGAFYAIKKKYYLNIFSQKSITGIPEGTVAEDTFIENMVRRESRQLVEKKVYYIPPDINDYCRYLARVRWQDRQLSLLSEAGWFADEAGEKSLVNVLKRKAEGFSFSLRCLIGATAAVGRFVFKLLYMAKIAEYYKKLGPVILQGGRVLSSATRSESTK